MQNAKPYVAAIKARGQLTIPKKVREAGNLTEGEVISIIPVGDTLIITPKKLELEEARREIRKILKSCGIPLDTLLEGLKEERESLYEETYGRKKD
jgi:AbrB family looped-hinge helix DNA binding protein